MSKRTIQATALTDLILEVFRFNGEMLSAGNRLTAPHGLTSARWQIMGAISIAERPLTASEIARDMGLSRQAVQRLLNDLKSIEMVKALENPRHKRAPVFDLTDDGRTALEHVDHAQIDWVNQLASGIELDTINAAIGILKTVRNESAAISRKEGT